jgi:hypothetical protein
VNEQSNPPPILDYHTGLKPPPAAVPEDPEALKLAKNALCEGAIALCTFWIPLLPMLLAYQAWDSGRQARRRAIGPAARMALAGMVMGCVAVVPNALIVLVAVLGVLWS